MPGKRRGHENTKSTPRDDWCTPQIIVDLVRRVWPDGIGLDPCDNPNSLTCAQFRMQLPDIDGLAQSWIPGPVYVNPPYGRGVNRLWAEKIAREAAKGTEIIALVPSCPGTRWFRENYWRGDAICFWSGRLRFLGAPANADFESAIVYFGPKAGRFGAVFKEHGHVVRYDPDLWYDPTVAPTVGISSTNGRNSSPISNGITTG